MATKQANWQLTNALAELRLPKFAAQVDVLKPALGLTQLSIAGQSLAGSLLQVDVPDVSSSDPHVIVDWYERCGDLVATYAQTDARPFRTQLYWRSESHAADDALAAIELVASVQTSLLDSHPELTVSSHVPCTEVWRKSGEGHDDFQRVACSSKHPFTAGASQPACYVMRLSSGLSYAQMVHPLDPRESTIKPVVDHEPSRETVEVRHRLFTADLEKGVILRSRVLGLFLPHENDLALASRHYAQFAAAEPPLTT